MNEAQYKEILTIAKGVQELSLSPSNDRFTWNSRPFLFTTENLKDSFDHINFDGKKVLTVTGSGDQALEAIFRGASHVDTFDSNLMQKCVLDLKTYAIKHLRYSDFMKCFFADTSRINLRSLQPLQAKLPEHVNIFLNGYQTCKNKTNFCDPLPYWDDIGYRKDLTSYTSSEQNYNTLKSRLADKNITFTLSDIRDISHKVKTKYNILYLSNVPLCINVSDSLLNFYNANIEKFKENILEKQESCIILAYMYGVDDYMSDEKEIFERIPILFDQGMDNNRFARKKFQSATKYSGSDGMLLVYPIYITR